MQWDCAYNHETWGNSSLAYPENEPGGEKSMETLASGMEQQCNRPDEDVDACIRVSPGLGSDKLSPRTSSMSQPATSGELNFGGIRKRDRKGKRPPRAKHTGFPKGGSPYWRPRGLRGEDARWRGIYTHDTQLYGVAKRRLGGKCHSLNSAKHLRITKTREGHGLATYKYSTR